MMNELKVNSESYESAAAEARDRGMAFMVDGKHVPADRVFILSVPDTVGPISEMRRAKDHARMALAELEVLQVNAGKISKTAHVEMTGQHLRQIMDVLGLPRESDHDDTYLGEHSYITMVDIETEVRERMEELKNVMLTYTAWRDEHKGEPLDAYLSVAGALDSAFNRMGLRLENRTASMQRINNMLGGGDGPDTSVVDSCAFTEAGVKAMLENVTKFREHSIVLNNVLWRMATIVDNVPDGTNDLFIDPQRLIDRFFEMNAGRNRQTVTLSPDPLTQRMQRNATVTCDVDNSRCKFAAGGAACTSWCGDLHCRPVVINGILVTDPELAAPISEAAAGTSCACGVCGKLFDGPGLFCSEHAQ